jgi:hypothetical protein
MKSVKNILKHPGVRRWSGPVAHVAARQFVGENKPLDPKLGVTLFRDRRVPAVVKTLALACGFAAMMVWNLLELPAEALIALLLPLGIPLEIAWNGAETLGGSLLFAALILPRVAPKSLVEEIRAERAPAPVPVEPNRKR